MSGIYIPGMKMPTERNGTVAIFYPSGKVIIEPNYGQPSRKFPVITVHDHGRLIDADALIDTLQKLFDKREKEQTFTGDRVAFVTWNDAIYHIKDAPTIIPADKENK